jgi:hypothetical protein
MTINPATYSKLPYDPMRDFAPISLICEFPLILTVDAKMPVRSVKELIEYAKANPGKANYASSAGIFQVTTELFKQKTGTKFEMIPYKSSGESVQAVISGLVTMTIVDPPPASGPLKAGTLRGLAVTSAKRHASWPDIPTMAEAGVPDMEVPVWTAFFAPAKTPSAIVQRLYKEVARVVHTPEVKKRFAEMGLDPVGSRPEDLAKTVARDVEKYTAVAKAASRTIDELLERPDLHLAPLDRSALRALGAAHGVLQAERTRGKVHPALIDLHRGDAVQPHGHVRAFGRNLVSIPAPAGLVRERYRHGGDIDDRASAVFRVRPSVPDVDLVAILRIDLLAVIAADEDAAIRVARRPELGAQLEVLVRILRHEKAALAAVGDHRAVLGAPVRVADTVEVLEAPVAIEQRLPAHAGQAQLRARGERSGKQSRSQYGSFHGPPPRVDG